MGQRSLVAYLGLVAWPVTETKSDKSRLEEAAEAKYAALVGTAEKLEATLKKFTGTADTCYATMRELHREIKKDQKDPRWAFWWLVLVVGTVAVAGGIFGNFLREAAVRILDALGAWWGS